MRPGEGEARTDHGDAMRPLRPLPLAQGELSEADAREFEALKRVIQERAGLFCDGYKSKCLRRRLAVRMRARGVHRYADYGEVLRNDPAEYDRLVGTLMINVSKFFRNPEVWDVLREQVIPALFELPGSPIRILSAGSAGGEEAYSVAILLLEHAERIGRPAAVRRFEIVGIDIDRDSLNHARRAEYGELALSDTPEAVRSRWFEGGPVYRLRPEPRRLVRFQEADLLKDEIPPGQHMILCRNVVIYFERAVQEALFARFREALVPGGYLVLGKVETLFGATNSGFRPIAGRERIFQKL